DARGAVFEAPEAERPGAAGAAQARRGAGVVALAVLGDADGSDARALRQRDVAVGAGEAAVEGERDALGDARAAVGLDAQDVGRVGEAVALLVRRGRRRERQQRDGA